jgi:hypothetical protein
MGIEEGVLFLGGGRYAQIVLALHILGPVGGGEACLSALLVEGGVEVVDPAGPSALFVAGQFCLVVAREGVVLGGGP